MVTGILYRTSNFYNLSEGVVGYMEMKCEIFTTPRASLSALICKQSINIFNYEEYESMIMLN